MKTKGFNSTEDYINCDKISPIRMSISYYIACFAKLSQVNGQPDDIYTIDLSKFNNLFNLISINFINRVELIVLLIHSSHETIQLYSENSCLKISHNEVIEVNHEKTLVELMPKPYSTSCVDYKQFGYNFRSYCIFKCKTNFFRKELNTWPNIYQTFDLESDLLMSDSMNSTFNLNAEQKCDKICGLEKDCVKEYYVP
jgi:hypothetical protein